MESSIEDIENVNHPKSEENIRNRETLGADATECISKEDTNEKCSRVFDNHQSDVHHIVESDALDCEIVSRTMHMSSSKDESFNMEKESEKCHTHEANECDLQAPNAMVNKQQGIDILCNQCFNYEKKQVAATCFCETCEDPDRLCGACSKQHIRQTQSQHHIICEDIDKFPNIIKDISNEKEQKLVCNICHIFEKTQVTATHFCKTCQDPEPWCEHCAKQHTRQKLSQDHILSTDIGKLPKVKTNSSHNMKPTEQNNLVCFLCSNDQKEAKATHFCQSCEDPEPLCETCAQYHTRQKLTKGHDMCADMEKFPAPQSNTGREKIAVCYPCSNNDIKVEATHFCQSCEDPEPLCERCAKHHTRQKLTKGHEMCANMAKFPAHQTNPGQKSQIGNMIICYPCSNGDIEVKATHFCQSCEDPEPLCETCTKHHTRQKLTKGHEMSADMAKFPAHQTNHGKKRSNEEEMKCNPCSNDLIMSNATHFCKTCEDPEPLCESCAVQHTRQKIAKDHDICDNMANFPRPLENVGKNRESEKERTCIPCLNDNIEVKATHFCKTCEDPEPLCKACAKQHTRQKMAKDHEICADLAQFSKLQQNAGKTKENRIVCNPCYGDNVEKKATHFCTTCEEPEPFCESCAKQHTRQRVFKEHELSDDIRKFLKITKYVEKTEENRIVCNPCNGDNVEKKATHVCTTCEDPEPFCESCAKQHTRQKVFREHQLSEDLRNCFKRTNNKGSADINPSESCVKEEKSYIGIPGQPSVSKIESDTVNLIWGKSESKVDHYQIRYKRQKGDKKWKFAETDADQSSITITGLMADTKYVFQVRGVYHDQEGDYGQPNDRIQTPKSLATQLLEYSACVDTGDPSKHQLYATELKDSRNEIAKTRKLVLGDDSNRGVDEKTIMLVGATGSGKSTLVDGIVNYVMGVSFDDPFRFTLVQLEEEEKKLDNQAVSQTEWITLYKIATQEGSRLNYTLNIIDTPGFGDTRGIDRDQYTVDQIRHLFSEDLPKGVLYLDAVCFIVKAPDARLTVSQKYIFSSIMALFGKDIESNICTLITFADGAEPPVLASLREAKLPFGSTFEFNNSALFAANTNLVPTSLSPMFWDMGCQSFQKFFDKICKFETRSLAQTKAVLQERKQLKNVLECIYPQVKAGLSKLSELRDQLDAFHRNINDIENNKDFYYEVEETKQIRVELKPGEHVTNCLHCNITCHESCAYSDDDEKMNCLVMDNDGNCTVCIKKCNWTEHKNTRYIFKYTTERVRKTYIEMKQKYEEAKGVKLNHKSFIEGLTRDVDKLFFGVKLRMREMKRCKSRLEVIALRPDPLSTVEHLDLMIRAEEMEKQSGYEQRIKVLNEFRHMALIDKDFENFDEEMQLTKQEMATHGLGSDKNILEQEIDYTKQEIETQELGSNKNFIVKGIDYIKEFLSPSTPNPPLTPPPPQPFMPSQPITPDIQKTSKNKAKKNKKK